MKAIVNGVSAIALVAGFANVPAFAQAAPASGEDAAQAAPDVEPADATDAPVSASDIIVTGSRLVANGYQAPTPVTVMSSQELTNASPSITEALRQLPQLTGSSSPSTPTFTPTGSGPSTSDTANLRNLGASRTLVLLDGRRPPASGITGTADISLFPIQLIKRVDIVTGGASAAYGSDAVAGVVNFILDTEFRGVLAEARNGISTYGDGYSFNVQLSAGLGFAGDKGSLIVNASIGGQDPVAGEDRGWAQRYWARIPNPLFGQAGEPQSLLRENVNLSAATFGGLIITPGALRDIQFDPAGNPAPYVHGTLNNGTLEVGGQGARYPGAVISDVRNRTLFARGTFEVADGASIFAEGYYGYSNAVYPNLYPYDLTSNAYLIQRDNAYLPESIRQTMVANGITSFRLGKVDLNYGRNIIDTTSKTFNATVGFKAEIGTFAVDGYYSHGETRFDMIARNQRITARALSALDAVVDPASGNIVCRSSLANPGNGCVPWNPFGSQPLTDAQRAYQGSEGFSNSIAKQDVAGLNVRGNLFSTWAGEVATAVGIEYRSQSGSVVVDPISQAAGFSATNPAPSGGKYNVKEAFGEILVPLFRGETFLQSVDLNGAIRRTDYSTSGGVTTWKVGLTSEVLSGLRLRGTYSQDIRAPNIADLFGPRTRQLGSVLDPFNGNITTSNIINFSGSNPNLRPEKAKTIAAGMSYRPVWLPGFGLSLDYYKIKISDAISTLPFQRIVDQCFAGDAALCALITRDSSNIITNINAAAINVQTITLSGFDFDASYRTSLGKGDLNLRVIASYLDSYKYVAPGTAAIEQANAGAFPRLRGTLQATYVSGGTTFSVQERLIGRHRRVILPTTIDNNDVPATFYTNVRIAQKIEAGDVQPELFLAVSNLFNQKPRINETNALGLGTARYVDAALYDVMGRYFTFGIRVRM